MSLASIETSASDVTTTPGRHAAGRLNKAPVSLWIGGAIITLVLVLAIAGPSIAPYNAEQFNLKAKLSPPSLEYLFGTDRFGRDMLSRLIVGARETVIMAVGSTWLSLAAGLLIGLIAGHRGGLLDNLLMRAMDVIMAFPALLLALLIAAILGGGTFNAILSVAIVFTPKIARVVRSAVLSFSGASFIEAAVLRGERESYILFREILPNIWPPLIVEVCIRLSYAVLVSVSLSYLGLGAQPPTPEWGLMIGKERGLLLTAPWVVIAPALAIVVLVIGINLFGDGLRNVLIAKKSQND